MNQRQRFIRKIIYACIIAALLLPLSWLSQPETTEATGGQLAQMRAEYNLSQAQLGEIDPASETIKLATLGMRGVAANLLWNKSHEYRKNEDWVNLSATFEQIAHLQPNFVSVWIYQGWNLSYNISVEFDDYHDRYYWVIKGIDFLKEGNEYNAREPRLLSKIGYTIANKIGRADEKELFRKLFRDDDDFHGDRPKAQRDNWLVGREWMIKAEQAVAEGVPLRGESPLLFYSHPVMGLINYAEAIQSEGVFGEVSKDAWRKAANSWNEYSNRDLPTQLNNFARLSEMEMYQERAKKAEARLAKVTPAGLAEEILDEKVAGLSEEDQKIFRMSPENRSYDQAQQASYLEYSIKVSPLEISSRIVGENRAEALQAAEEAAFAQQMADSIDVDRDIVNYKYWTLRCEIEPTDEVLAARKQIYDADQALTNAELLPAVELYEKGMQSWRKVLDNHPELIVENSTVDELSDTIDHYQSVLDQLDRKRPDDFILQDILDKRAELRGELPAKEATRADKDAAEAAANDPSKSAP